MPRKNRPILLLCALALAVLAAAGCDSSSNNTAAGARGGPVVVTLNAAGNVADVEKDGEVYQIDASAHPTAQIEAASVTLQAAADLPRQGFPNGYSAPDGFLGFIITGLDPAGGETVVLTLTFPTAAGALAAFCKSSADGFAFMSGVSVEGNTVHMALTDNGPGDQDQIPGQITDPGGPVLLDYVGFIDDEPQGSAVSRLGSVVFDEHSHGSEAAVYKVQRTSINTSGDDVAWQFENVPAWLNIAPQAGVGRGEATFTLNQAELTPGTHTGRVGLASGNASQPIDLKLEVSEQPDETPPIGSLDTPADGAAVSGSVPVSGWSLDNVGVDEVRIYIYDENDTPLNDVEIPADRMVDGLRPEVTAAHSDLPASNEAGWTYNLVTNLLPDGGNGTYKIEARATDLSGNEASLGVATIHADNLNAVKPFGALETPGLGEWIFGVHKCMGWVLTPQPKTIPPDGSTIDVLVDGKFVGHPDYGIDYGDIAQKLPGYNNSNGAWGSYMLDTTKLENGTHTIQWRATDDSEMCHVVFSQAFFVLNEVSSIVAD